MRPRHYTSHPETTKFFEDLLGSDALDTDAMLKQLQGGADILVTDEWFLNNTILIWAIANTNIKNLGALLDLLRDYFKKTPEILTSFLNYADDDGKTALFLALTKGWLHQNTVDDSCDTNPHQRPYMHTAIKALIEHGADVNIADNNGNTPLHIAVLHRDTEAVAYLLEQGADISVKNRNGIAALQMLQYNFDEAASIIKAITPVFTIQEEKDFNSSYPNIVNAFRNVWSRNQHEPSQGEQIIEYEDPAQLKIKIDTLLTDMLLLFRANVDKITTYDDINALLVKNNITVPLFKVTAPVDRLINIVNRENATATFLGYSSRVWDCICQLFKRIFGINRERMIQSACNEYKRALNDEVCNFTPSYKIFASEHHQKKLLLIEREAAIVRNNTRQTHRVV